jgi:general secretion pathway protein B
MSFILDALRRLEEKREPETAGDIIAVARGGPGPSRRKPLWPWFLICALSVNVILVTGWYFTRGERGEEPSANPPAEQASPAGGPGAGEDASSAPPVVKAEKAAGLSPTSAPEAGSGEGGRSVFPPPVLQRVKEAAPPATSSPLPAAATGEEMDDIPPFPLGGEGPDASEAEEGPADPGEGDQGVPGEMTDSRVYSFEELPEELQESLKDLKIVAHVYSDDPAFRLLSIGEGLQREGEKVRQGLLLEEISPDGATFGYGRYHFRLGAN